MGGHGGLNILPQKRWNVYNFENRERVRRDEEAAAREEQVRRAKARQAELEFKVDTLRKVNQSKRRRVESVEGSDGAPSSLEGAATAEGAIIVRELTGGAERPQHINFFAEFEATASEEGPSHDRRDKDRAAKGSRKGEERESRGGRKEEGWRKEQNVSRGIEKVDGKPTGEPVNENYSLGHGLLDKNGKKPWYTYKSFMVDRTTTTDGEQRSDDAKLQITGSSEKKKDKSTKKTVEELRAERLKREQLENDKVRRLVVSKAAKSSTGYNPLPNGRVPQYHASYGNAR
ncbi:unnamed protein product [Calypogeia fissa]